ncbi:hypothetical protein T05_1579 [Trichinella murrelli]|uniref:Uncharacterized protein n=1 Tax=Trichinella murrelli TaxID=144512 RepID=A0A0V0UD31_9BILA|nr:hypothetical protein T05_1579 [Trichinella murrelli]
MSIPWAYTKIGTIQRRLAWPLRKDDTQIREAFQIFFKFHNFFSRVKVLLLSDGNISKLLVCHYEFCS